MTVVDFTQADVHALELVLRVMQRLDDIGSLFEEPVSPRRDAACDRLDDLSSRMLRALDDEPFLPLLPDTRDHSKAAEFRLVRGGRCV